MEVPTWARSRVLPFLTVGCWLLVVVTCLPDSPLAWTAVRPLLCVVTSTAAVTAWSGASCWKGQQRLGWSLLSAGITAYALGYLVLFCDAGNYHHGLFGVSLSDCISLMLYPLGYLGLSVLTLRRQHQRDRTALLEGAVMATGAGAGAVIVVAHLYPMLLRGPALTVLYDLAYAVGGLTLLGGTVTALAISGWRMSRSWALLTAGLACMTVGDAAYGLAAASHTFRFGTWSEILYTAGPVGVALATTQNPWRVVHRAADPRPSMVITALASLTAIGLLVLGQFWMVPTAAVVLAACCGVLAVVRASLSFHQSRLLDQTKALARTDELTGLPNRRSLIEQLQRASCSDDPYVALLLDLDGFKSVNDQYGHAVGDELLTVVAGRLRAVAHPSQVCRLGGDEFAFLHLGTLASARELGAALTAEISRPAVLGTVTVTVGVSIGAAALEDDHPPSEALRRADVALYCAKATRGEVQLWHPLLDDASRVRTRRASELRDALDSGQLVLHFQPQVEDDRIRGYEAVVRWQHPEEGLLLPEHFLDAVQTAGLLEELTNHVLRSALSALTDLRDPQLSIAVNVETSDLLRPGFVDEVGAALTEAGVAPERLLLEVGEAPDIADVLAELRRAGVRISLDDFGTATSSISAFRLPVDEVKLDRSLTAGIVTDRVCELVLTALLRVTEGLGIQVVAEGVEHPAQQARLCELGVTVQQGWHLGRPVPLGALLATRAGTPPRPRTVGRRDLTY